MGNVITLVEQTEQQVWRARDYKSRLWQAFCEAEDGDTYWLSMAYERAEDRVIKLEAALDRQQAQMVEAVRQVTHA